MGNYYKDNDDLRFYFERGLDWRSLYDRSFASVGEAAEFYREIAELTGAFAADEIAPYAAEIDREGVRLEGGEVVFPSRANAIFDRIRELDLHGMCLPRELGGMNAPALVYFANVELFSRADVSVMAHHGFHGGIAMALLVFSLREGTTTVDGSGRVVSTRFRREIDEIVSGRAWGCMDITEPDAGSDMARLRTYAEQDAAGAWFVTGEKIFITSGHGKYHFVIARTEKASDVDDPLAGLSGLSMFLVKTYDEDASGRRTRIVPITRVEEKLGHHGSATCALSFDRAPAELIGKRGDGFRHMLTLMNNARLGVGFESIGLMEAAHRMARAYAAERRTMGKTIDRHEMIADYLDEMRTDLSGLRALAMAGAYNEESAMKLDLVLRYGTGLSELQRKRLTERHREHERRARRLTPLLKYLAAEKAVEAARRNVQIHGGNGYMRELGAEKLLRDAMVMPIYEGTSQIQSLMAMKDALTSVLKNPQAFVRRIAQARLRALSARDPLERRLGRIQSLSLSAQQHLVVKTAGDKLLTLLERPLAEWPDRLRRDWDPKRDFATALLHAERLTRLLADEAIGELLYEQARKHADRRELCERYIERAEPRARFLNDEITTTGQRLLVDLGRRSETPRLADAAE